MMKSFGKKIVVDVKMRYGGSNVVFNASIHNNESMGRGLFENLIVK